MQVVSKVFRKEFRVDQLFCFAGLKESERALYAELWLGQLIYDRLVMVPQVFSSGCSKVPLSDMGFLMAVAFCAKRYS